MFLCWLISDWPYNVVQCRTTYACNVLYMVQTLYNVYTFTFTQTGQEYAVIPSAEYRSMCRADWAAGANRVATGPRLHL